MSEREHKIESIVYCLAESTPTRVSSFYELESLRAEALKKLGAEPQFAWVSMRTFAGIVSTYQSAQRFTETHLGSVRALYWTGTIVLQSSTLEDNQMEFGVLGS